MRPSIRWSLGALIVLVAGSLAVLLQQSGPGERVELASYDWRMRLRGELPPPTDAPIVILQVDDASFEQINRPLVFWQPLFADLIGRFAQAEASVVGLDLIFTDVDLVIDRLGLGGTERTQSHVRTLAAAILTAGAAGTPVVIGCKWDDDPCDEIPISLILAAGEGGTAFVNLTTDSDDFVRRQLLLAQGPEGQADGMAMAVARAYREYQEIPFTPIPGSPNTILINYRGLSHFPAIPLWQAVEASEAGDTAFFDRFRGQIVLIGLVSDDDRHPTPLYSWASANPDRKFRRTAGVEIHANTIATLLEGDFIRPLALPGRILCTFLLVVIGTVACFLLSPAIGIGAGVALGPVYFLIAEALFARGLAIPVAGPVAGLFLAVSMSQVAHYALEGREKRRLRSLFKRYVDDRVIERILAMPELTLQGERKRISVLFSDIRNFTARSEAMSPEALVDLLNRYFELMVRAVQYSHGTVDKFIGDGMMAVFGAPLDDGDSAYNATRAALAMQVALRELNIELEGEGRPPIEIGIGIHTGEAVVGNIGSSERLEYTAIGDVVNTSSRIEGLNKQFGTRILISEETFQDLKGRIPARPRAETLVKGKAREIRVFELDPELPLPPAAD